MKGYRISVIRHGRTAANDKGIYIGRTDGCTAALCGAVPRPQRSCSRTCRSRLWTI